MNYYKHHIGDYRRDTAHLSLLEHGIYRQLMDTYYLSESPIPSETELVMRRLAAKTKEEREAVELVLREFFLMVDGAWKHARCDAEIEAYHKRSDASAANGKHGGRPKGKPKKTKAVTGRGASEKATTNHQPLTNNQSPPSPAGDVRFAEFWLAWPKHERKQDRKVCREKWIAHGLDLVADVILADVQAKKSTNKWREGFIEAPEVYINNRRWEDGAPSDLFDWWKDAGFSDKFEAENAGCRQGNIAQFRDGKRIAEAA